MSKSRAFTRTLAQAALMAALSYIGFQFFRIDIPVGDGRTAVHMGNAFVVLGGLGNIWGSIIAATVLYILPEILRSFADYRMLIYAIVLIVVMLATNSTKVKELAEKLRSRKEEEEKA